VAKNSVSLSEVEAEKVYAIEEYQKDKQTESILCEIDSDHGCLVANYSTGIVSLECAECAFPIKVFPQRIVEWYRKRIRNGGLPDKMAELRKKAPPNMSRAERRRFKHKDKSQFGGGKRHR